MDGYAIIVLESVLRCSPYGGKGSFPIFLALNATIPKDFTAEVQRVRGDQARLSLCVGRSTKGIKAFFLGVESTNMLIFCSKRSTVHKIVEAAKRENIINKQNIQPTQQVGHPTRCKTSVNK